MEKGTINPSAKPGTKGRWPKGKANQVPRVKVLTQVKSIENNCKLIAPESDIFAILANRHIVKD